MKLFITFCIATLIFSQVSADEINQEFSYPGGVYIKEISFDEFQNGFYYLDIKVPTLEKNNNYYLLFGIPRDIDIKTKGVILRNGDKDYVLTLTIKEKSFGKQYINISEKFTNPSDAVIERIIEEKNILNSARKKWISNNIDTDFILPVIGQISGVFGTNRFYNNKRGNYHNGVDFAASTGTDIIAPSSGEVLLTGDFFYNGKFVYMDHGMNLKSIFIHMDSINVNKGDYVNKGEIIGHVGNTGKSTGPHLHWSVTLNSVYVDPMIFINNTIIH